MISFCKNARVTAKVRKSDKNGPAEKPQATERDPITDIRFPLMILFLVAATSTFLIEVPPWMTLPACAVFAAGWSLVRERRLIMALIRNWRSGWLVIAPVVALFLYALLELAIQAATASLVESGALTGQQELPALFKWLLALRSSAGDMPPVILGLGGGLLLGIGEELFWRGFVQTRLMMVTGHGLAVLITAVLYGVFYLFTLGPLAAVLCLLLGIILSMFTLRSRSLLPAIFCHSLFLVVSLWLHTRIVFFAEIDPTCIEFRSICPVWTPDHGFPLRVGNRAQ